MKRNGMGYNHRDPQQVEMMARYIAKSVCTDSDVTPYAKKALELALTMQQRLNQNGTTLYKFSQNFLGIKNRPWRKSA